MSDDPTQPFPPRFRQLKQWSLFAVVTIALLAGLRVWWGHEAQRRRDEYIAAAHARGERILPADFAVEAVSDDQNAATVLRSAAGAISYTSQQETWENNFAGTLPLAAGDVAAIQSLAWRNRVSLAQARQARSLAGVDWGTPIGWQTMGKALSPFNQQRGLTNLLGYVALGEHQIGNDAEVVELMLDMDRQRSAVGRVSPYLVTMLVAIGMDAAMTRRVIDIAPTLDVTPVRSAQPATTRPASRDRVRYLIDQLLDETDVRAVAIAAWEGEAMLSLDMSATMAQQLEPRVTGPLLRPMYVLDGVRLSRGPSSVSKYRAAATQPTYRPVDLSGGVPSGGQKSHLHQIATTLSDMGQTPTKVHEVQFGALTDRRAAAIALAIRLYALDHAGALPPTLNELAPDYLPRVPADPFSRDGQSFRYIPQRASPRLYSVGVNDADDGGSPWWSNRWNNPDAVYLLSPAVPPATAPAATQSGS